MTQVKTKQAKFCPNCKQIMERKGWIHEVDNKQYFEYFCTPCVHIELVKVKKYEAN